MSVSLAVFIHTRYDACYNCRKGGNMRPNHPLFANRRSKVILFVAIGIFVTIIALELIGISVFGIADNLGERSSNWLFDTWIDP
jgi:hypothetical protein